VGVGSDTLAVAATKAVKRLIVEIIVAIFVI